MRQTVHTRMTSCKQAATVTKPTNYVPTKGLRRDPIAANTTTFPAKSSSTKLPISHGSIFRWRPSQSLGFQVAAVTAKSAADFKSETTATSSTSSVSSSATDLISMSTYSTLPSSNWTSSENSPSTSASGGGHSTLFVISKIDPWGPMAIFAPQLKVGMRIVAINHQPCPKTQEGLHAILESSHAPTNPEAPAPAGPPKRMNLDGANDQKNKSKEESSTGWITIHAVDLKEELKQRQYYLNQVGRGFDPDEQRSEESSEAAAQRPMLDEIREEAEVISVIQVEIVASELKQRLAKNKREEEEENSELKQQLKVLHFLEEERQRALFREARERKKERRNEKKERQRIMHDRYMDQNIWNMKLKDSDAHSAQNDSALDNFSILPAVATKKTEPKPPRKKSLKDEMAAMEKLQEVRELSEIHKKVQSIEDEKKKAKKEKKEKKTKKVKEVQSMEPTVDAKADWTSDWNPFASFQKMLLASPPPPPTLPSPAEAAAKSQPPIKSKAPTSHLSTASTISSKASGSPGDQEGGWFSGWNMQRAADGETSFNIIDNVPQNMKPKISISPQRWSCLPVVETESVKTELQFTPVVNENSSRKDPEGVRATSDGVRSSQPEHFQQKNRSKRVDANATAPVSSPNKAVFQLRKLGNREKQSKRDKAADAPIPAQEPAPSPVDCPSDQPQQSQLRKVGKRDTMRPKWSPQFESYNDSMRSKTIVGISEKSAQRATVGQLRQLIAHLEMTKQAEQIPKQSCQPMGKTNRLKNQTMPFPEQARRRNLAELNEQREQFKESHRDPSIPSYLSVGTTSSASSIISRLGEDQELQESIPSFAEMTLLGKEQKAKGKQTKAVAACSTANTTTAFTLPISRSKSSSDEKKKQLKKLQATWKAARLRSIQEAKEAAEGAPGATRKASGPRRDWNVSSLFMSFFHCGEMENGVLDSKYDTPF